MPVAWKERENGRLHVDNANRREESPGAGPWASHAVPFDLAWRLLGQGQPGNPFSTDFPLVMAGTRLMPGRLGSSAWKSIFPGVARFCRVQRSLLFFHC